MNTLEENLELGKEEESGNKSNEKEESYDKSIEKEEPDDKLNEKEEPDSKSNEKEEPDNKTNEKEEDKWFVCYLCNLKELYDSKGTEVSFSKYITFTEDSYVVRDPFTPPEKRQFFLLGSDCVSCKNPVCRSEECSIFYKRTYCQKCALESINSFPEQLRSKIKKP